MISKKEKKLDTYGRKNISWKKEWYDCAFCKLDTSLQCDSALRNIVRLYPYDVSPNIDTTGDGVAYEGSLELDIS